MDTYIKNADGKLELRKTIPQEIIPAKQEVRQYDYDFLVRQKIAVERDLANIVSRHATELGSAQGNVDEVNTLLLKADELGIKEKQDSDQLEPK